MSNTKLGCILTLSAYFSSTVSNDLLKIENDVIMSQIDNLNNGGTAMS